MNRHLCLKWNNHSSAFLKTFHKISFKEKYCDATIVCHETYFPVHRLVLSTCSTYFEDLFERIHCQHPYIIFKDIEPKQMELLLNYMYQGEVNVLQECLPSLIKAAESLRIKGLVVPDDRSLSKEPFGKKRNCPPSDSSQPSPKRKLNESQVYDLNSFSEDQRIDEQMHPCPNTEGKNNDTFHKRLQERNNEDTIIKEEALNEQLDKEMIPVISDPLKECDSNRAEEDAYKNNSNPESSFFKVQAPQATFEEPFREQSSSFWDTFSDAGAEQDLQTDINNHTEVSSMELVPVSVLDIATSSSKALPRDQHPGQCPHCDYDNYSNLARHIRAKHPEQKPHQCLFCTSRFLTRRALERHIVSHTGKDPFKCPVCFVEFFRFSSLNSHFESCFGRYTSY